jgi:hypothetical protein
MSTTPDSFSIPKRPLRRLGGAIACLVAVAVIAGVVFLTLRAVTNDPLASAINSKEYQAVFLTNGQVYFGKLTAPGGDFYYLRDIYYLQSQISPQGGKQVHQTLHKLGDEIHGPEDLMVINRSQILFVENLKPSGQVSRAISGSG